MKKKIVTIWIILGILLVGILSASLISHFGKITGTVVVTSVTPNMTLDCKNEGWMDLTKIDGSAFKNQGDCVSYVNTHMCNNKWENLTKDDGSEFKNQGECVSYFNKKEKGEPKTFSINESNQTNNTFENITNVTDEDNESLEINQTENITIENNQTEDIEINSTEESGNATQNETQ